MNDYDIFVLYLNSHKFEKDLNEYIDQNINNKFSYKHINLKCHKDKRIKRDRAYRMYIKSQKLNKQIELIKYNVYNPFVGWLSESGNYIKKARHYNYKRYLKNHSNRIVRKSKLYGKGNLYRKMFDYWWELF